MRLICLLVMGFVPAAAGAGANPAHEVAAPPQVLPVTDAALVEASQPFAAFKAGTGLPAGETVRVCYHIPGKHDKVSYLTVDGRGAVNDVLSPGVVEPAELTTTISGPNLNAVTRTMRATD